MSYSPGAGNRKSRKNISSYLDTSTDSEGDVFAVYADSSEFGIKLWGAIDGFCAKHGTEGRPAHLVIRNVPDSSVDAAVDADDFQPVVVRRMSKEEKRQRALQQMLEAKRGAR